MQLLINFLSVKKSSQLLQVAGIFNPTKSSGFSKKQSGQPLKTPQRGKNRERRECESHHL
jgi:hypothetical protein